MAKRINTILPDLTLEESLEVTKVYSVSGEKHEKGLMAERPFRSPHYTISTASLVGGGTVPKPGEISLSHLGVLLLDEFPEFKKSVLEALRIPLEDKKITINRLYGKFTYPCNFMLVASMNPCPCGYFGNKEKTCKCTKQQIQNYRNKISGPLMDRIDIHINVPNIKFASLRNTKEESSKKIKERIEKARQIQKERYKEYEINTNSELTSQLIERFCKISDASKVILENYFEQNKISVRSYFKILKIARTIADLSAKEMIEEIHILEALRYRCMDKRK